MEDLGLARTYARRALELDPTSVGAQQAIGFLAYFERDWVAAHRAFTAALARDPDNPMTLQFFSVWYLVQNRNDEACAMSLRAEALAPDWMITSAHAVWMLHYSGRLDDAIHKARALIRRDRLFWRGYFNLALSLIARGRYQEAVKAAEVGAALSDVPALQAVLVDAAARAGDRGRAQRTLADIRSRRTYFSPYWHALACTGLGDHRSALTQLRRSVDRCEWFLAFLKHDPGFAALHGAPAFAAVCQQAGLP
jgi:tetratricopeptide (TPR) repeat protein